MAEALKRLSHSTSAPPVQPPSHSPEDPDANIDPRLRETPYSASTLPSSEPAQAPRTLRPPETSARKDSAFASASIGKTPLKRKRLDTLEGLLPGINGYLDSPMAARPSSDCQNTNMSGSNSSLTVNANASASTICKAKTVRIVSPGQNPQRLWEEKLRQEAARRVEELRRQEEELRRQEESEEIQYDDDGGREEPKRGRS